MITERNISTFRHGYFYYHLNLFSNIYSHFVFRSDSREQRRDRSDSRDRRDRRRERESSKYLLFWQVVRQTLDRQTLDTTNPGQTNNGHNKH